MMNQNNNHTSLHDVHPISVSLQRPSINLDIPFQEKRSSESGRCCRIWTAGVDWPGSPGCEPSPELCAAYPPAWNNSQTRHHWLNQKTRGKSSISFRSDFYRWTVC